MSDSKLQSRFDVALAVLRGVLGVVFIAHGVQKLFIYGVDGIAGAFGSMGLPPLLGPVIGTAELLGGIALLAGFLTPVAAAGLTLIMAGAIATVHGPQGFFAPKGYEFNLTLIAGLVAIALTGAGAFSLDAVLLRRRARGGR
jgi:putative oxidoreductase